MYCNKFECFTYLHFLYIYIVHPNSKFITNFQPSFSQKRSHRRNFVVLHFSLTLVSSHKFSVLCTLARFNFSSTCTNIVYIYLSFMYILCIYIYIRGLMISVWLIANSTLSQYDLQQILPSPRWDGRTAAGGDSKWLRSGWTETLHPRDDSKRMPTTPKWIEMIPIFLEIRKMENLLKFSTHIFINRCLFPSDLRSEFPKVLVMFNKQLLTTDVTIFTLN